MRKVLNVFMILVVLGAGGGGAYWFVKTRREPPRRKILPRPPLVEVIQATRGDHEVVVEAMGTVIPAKEVLLHAEVSGRVIKQTARLVPGDLFMAGEVIACIDPRDYELAVEREKARVEQAVSELKLEEGRQVVARREWSLLGSHPPSIGPAVGQDGGDAGGDLALRKPHLRSARAAIAAAQSSLNLAKIKLERATILAPFNALVEEEFIDVGQFVTPQTPLVRLIGTDRFWVRVSLPVAKLAFIKVPGVNGCAEAAGSRATIVLLAGEGRDIEREGRVIRLLGSLEPRGRMARVLIEVKNPLGLKSAPGLPLLLGAYVRARLRGITLKNVCVLPRETLREGDRVWIAEGGRGSLTLTVRKDIGVAYRGKGFIVIGKGLNGGESVIVSRLDAAVDGKRVRVGTSDSQELDLMKARIARRPEEDR